MSVSLISSPWYCNRITISGKSVAPAPNKSSLTNQYTFKLFCFDGFFFVPVVTRDKLQYFAIIQRYLHTIKLKISLNKYTLTVFCYKIYCRNNLEICLKY
jgi:hypothetical protein